MVAHADSRDIMFKVRKQGKWHSLDVRKEHPVVSGKKYKLEEVGNIRSPEPGVFAFVNLQEEGKVNTTTALEDPPLWHNERLTSKRLAAIIEQFCDKVYTFLYFDIYVEYNHNITSQALSSSVVYPSEINGTLFPNKTSYKDVNLRSVPTGLRHLDSSYAGLSKGKNYRIILILKCSLYICNKMFLIRSIVRLSKRLLLSCSQGRLRFCQHQLLSFLIRYD